MEVIKRNGNIEEFNKDKIKSSIEKASKSLEGKTKEKIDEKKLKDIVDEIERKVVEKKREKIQSEIIKQITFYKLQEKGFKDIAKEYEKNGLIEISAIPIGSDFEYKVFMYKVLNRNNETPKILSNKGSKFNFTFNFTKDIYGDEELVRKIEVEFSYNNTRALSDLFEYLSREDSVFVYNNNIKKPYVAFGCLTEALYLEEKGYHEEKRYHVRILSNVIFKDIDRGYYKGGGGVEDASKTTLVGYCEPYIFNKKSILEITKNFYDRDHAKEFLKEELKKIKKGKLRKIYLIKTNWKYLAGIAALFAIINALFAIIKMIIDIFKR